MSALRVTVPAVQQRHAGRISGRMDGVIIVRGNGRVMQRNKNQIALEQARAVLYGLKAPDWSDVFEQLGIVNTSTEEEVHEKQKAD